MKSTQFKTIQKVLKSVQKSTQAEQLYHEQTRKPTLNPNQQAGCNTIQGLNQNREQTKV